MEQDFSKNEKKLIRGIGFLMGIRMLGVSMIIPVFSIFASEIPGSTKELAGIAVGIFGVSQTIFQIPMGRLSDRWGRKQTTLFGLAIYLAGTVMSGLSSNVYFLIISRFIAGAGAVSGVTMAWLTDGINIHRRNAALSLVGISIGLSVISGFTMSSVIAGYLGIPYLFYICAVLTAAAALYTARYLDNQDSANLYGDVSPITLRDLTDIFKNKDLLRLNVAGFSGNISLTGMFFIMPLLIKQEMAIQGMWKIYVPMALIGTACMYYFGKKADTMGTVKIASLGFILEIIGALVPLISTSIFALLAAFILFYSGHCIISPVLPAAVSRHPSEGRKGTVMSIFNSSQYIGSGLSGIASGLLLKYAPNYIFILIIALICAVLYTLSRFRNYAS